MALNTLLHGKKCLVTGASSGIGLATARVLAREGAQVFATGRNEDALRKLQSDIGCDYLPIDLSADDAAKTVVDAAVAKLGGLTTVVNCAGVLQGGAFGTDACNLQNYDFNFNMNTRTAFNVMIHSIPHLKKCDKGLAPSIINVSSVTAQQSFAATATYCASKAALDMLTECAAVDLAPFGIRVNAVNPGVIITPLQKRGGMSDEAYSNFLDRSVSTTHPIAQSLGRCGEPEEVGDLIAFLASNKSLFITGDCIKIDGGRACLGAR